MINILHFRGYISFVVRLLLFILIISCNKQRPDAELGMGNASRIKFSFSDLDLKQSDVFKVVDVINLATNDSSLIGYMSTVVSRLSGFYVLDSELCKHVVKFDCKGNFLYSINKQGRGPGEFLSIYEICVDREDKYLYLFDAIGKKIICYDAHNGEYVRSFKCVYNAFSFSVLPNGKDFIFYCSFMPNNGLRKDNSFPNFIVTDSLGKIKNTFSYFDEKIESPNLTYLRTVFCHSDSILYCFNRYNDNILGIENFLNVSSIYYLDYMSDNQDKNEIFMRKVREYENIDFGRNERDLKNANVYELSKMTAIKKFIYFMGYYEDEPFYFLYDKVRDKSLNISVLKEDILGASLYFMDADNEYFYIPVPINLLKKLISKNPKNYDPMIKKAVLDVNDDDNPVIIKVKVLDFV